VRFPLPHVFNIRCFAPFNLIKIAKLQTAFHLIEPAVGGGIYMANRYSAISRRNLLGAALGSAAAAAASRALPIQLFAQDPQSISFPRGFWWGTSTASYQVEGAWKEDGKGESIWDRFSHTPGKIKNGDTGDVACDHYHQFKEDVQIMRDLGMNSYRFSISWPRIQPTGKGKANEKGVDFYKRLIDALLEAKIRPFPTLYHWDLPQALEDTGGWPNRDIAQRFADYAEIAARRLGDRLQLMGIFNEPWVFTALGYLLGTHAPGRTDLNSFMRSTHTVNLAQGMAYRAIKAAQPKVTVGTAFNMSIMHPATDSSADKQAAERVHQWGNIWFLDPALKGTYPALAGVTPEQLGIRPGDMEKVRAPLDFIGINNYNRIIVSAKTSASESTDPFSKILQASIQVGGSEGPKTDNGWEVYPRGLYEIVMRITKDYSRPIIEITENGCAYGDAPDARGIVNDRRRIDFYRGNLTELAHAIRDDANLRGYHAWSLMDNFEWADGYTQRFGLVYVDYGTQKRTLKESGKWYSTVAKANALPASG
jgi:beta-glucosidase